MDYAKLNDRLQILGMIGIIASLAFVGLQLVQSQKIANSERVTGTLNSRITINESVIQNAPLLAKANRGEELSDEEHIVLKRIIDSFWSDSFFGQYATDLVGGVGGSGVPLALFLYDNPGARKEWTTAKTLRNRKWEILFRPDTPMHRFDDAVDGHLAKLDEQLD